MTAKPIKPNYRFIAQEWASRGLLDGCDRPVTSACNWTGIILFFNCPQCFEVMHRRSGHLAAAAGMPVAIRMIEQVSPNALQSGDRPNLGC